MNEADSKAAVEAAERAKVTTAVWLGQAIREAVARERQPSVGDVMPPAAAATDVTTPPNHWGSGLTGDVATKVAIASIPELPRWLRSAVYRQLGAVIGVQPPAPPKRRPARLTVDSE